MTKILDEILRLSHDLRAANDTADEIKVSHQTYDALRASPTITQVCHPAGLPETVFGMRIVIDPELAPGEWKLVTPNQRRVMRYSPEGRKP